MQKNYSFLLFLGIALAELIAVLLENEPLQWVFKPLLMPALLFHLFTSIPTENRSKLFRYITLALLFSMGGDVALLFSGKAELYFILGLASFLIAHICYIVAFHKLDDEHQTSFWGRLRQRNSFPIALVIVGYGITLYSYLFPKLDAFLKVPVALYALAITLMALSLLIRKELLAKNVFNGMFLGVLLFIFSDSCIAIDRFAMPIPKANFVIMITYIAAQYLIVRGVIKKEAPSVRAY
ncbi:MAG: lysoplasmalogenase [Flammeovirgaceae bacterium]